MTASIIAQMEQEPVPTTIGMGPIKITAPAATVSPESIVAVTTNVIPTNIKMSPTMNRLKGIDQAQLFHAAAFGLRLPEQSAQNHVWGSKQASQTLRPHS